MKQQSLIHKEILPLVWGLLGLGLVALYWDGLSDGWGYPTLLGLLGISLWSVGSWLGDIVIWGKTRRLYVPSILVLGIVLAVIQVVLGGVSQLWSIPSLGLLTFVLWIVFVWAMSSPRSMGNLRLLYWGIEVGVTISAVYTLVVALGGGRFVGPIWSLFGINTVPETLVGADLGTQVLASSLLLVSGVVHMIYMVYDTKIAKKERPLSVLFYLGVGVVNASFLFAFWGQEGAVIPALSVILTLGALAVLYLKPGLIIRNKKLRLPGFFLLILITSLVALVVFSGARSVIVAEDNRLSQQVVPLVLNETQDSMIFGEGIGTGDRNVTTISEGQISEISNTYLKWYLETGLMGVVIGVLALMVLIAMIWRSYRDQSLYDDPFYISAVLGLFQVGILGIFVSFNIFLILVSSVYVARIVQHSLKDKKVKTLTLAKMNPQGQIGMVLGLIAVGGLLVWGGWFMGTRVYADILWNQQLNNDQSSEEYLESLQTILDYNPVHTAAAEQYIVLRLGILQDVREDPALLEQTVTDILGTTQDLVEAYPQWYQIHLLEAQVLLELSTQVLLPDFWFEDRLQALQKIAPESAQTLATEARFIMVKVAAESQNAQLYQGLNVDDQKENASDTESDPSNELDQVVPLLDSAVEKNPALADIWIARVVYLEQVGQQEEVSVVLEEYVTYVAENQIPADPELVLLLVQEYIDTEQFAQAESYLQQVQRAYPNLQSVDRLEENLQRARGEIE